MKSLWMICLISLTISGTAISQDYKTFRVGLGFGVAILSDGLAGGSITLEPAYRINNDLAIGLNIEGALFGFLDEAEILGSCTLNGQYYLSDNAFRPFIGSGLGLYRYGNAGFETRVGFYPRVGFDLEHFSMSCDYNILPGVPAYSHHDMSHYFRLRIGFFVGGGKK